jgi:hypothetical protein
MDKVSNDNLAFKAADNARKVSLIQIVAILLGFFSSWVAFHYREQPLLEAYGFRQTQTALSAFWLKDNFKLAYETPVGGYPWSIPFEFPLYQWIVAKISNVVGSSLDSTGRIVSFAFLISCLWPIAKLSKLFSLDKDSFWIFACLFLSSPLYIFWGRAFMMETTALFFSLAFIPYSIQLQRNPQNLTSALFAGSFLAIGLLQKITTGLPILAVMGTCYLIAQFSRDNIGRPRLKTFICFLAAYAAPFLIAIIWSYFTDEIKKNNALGAQLTSSALIGWNFGTVSQRLSLEFWAEVIWNRMFASTAGGLLGLALLMYSMCQAPYMYIRRVTTTAALLFLLPFSIFTNLHKVHDYYQVSAGIFLVGGLAIAINLLNHGKGNYLSPTLITILIAISNLIHLHNGYWKNLNQHFDESNNRTLAIAEIIRDNTPENSAFVAFGYDWNSELAYYSQRKSFTVPEFFSEYQNALDNPQAFLGSVPLAAIVICPSTKMLSEAEIEQRMHDDPLLIQVDIFDCKVLIRATS